MKCAGKRTDKKVLRAAHFMRIMGVKCSFIGRWMMSVWGSDKKAMTKMEAALEQIDAAIEAFHAGRHACAITLAGAAEGQIIHTERDHVWAKIIERVPAGVGKKQWVQTLNETRDWLKHPTERLGAERHIDEFECVLVLIRASSKFVGRYAKSSKAIDEFADWCRANNYLNHVTSWNRP